MNLLRPFRSLITLPLFASSMFGQASGAAPTFDVASVRQSQHQVGPDYDNQISYPATGIIARNVTLRRLVAEAYRLQVNQVLGPDWLDRNEYDIEAKSAQEGSRERTTAMLQVLLAERFNLKQHSEKREMRVYELVVDKTGLKIHPASNVETDHAGAGIRFHGNLREFADLLSLQLSIPALNNPNEPARASGPPIPVLDETGLSGVYDFSVGIRPELSTDMFTLWQRNLQAQLGLRLESRKGAVKVLVVDDAAKIPTEN